MKISGASLKGMNFKQLAIDHGEKFALGVVVLLVLFALFTTSWARYDRSPEELLAETDQTKQTIAESEWPQPQQTLYNTEREIRQEITTMLTPMETARFQYKTELIAPLYQKKEPIQEPDWLAVRNVIADAGRTTIELSPPTSPEKEREGRMLVNVPQRNEDLMANADIPEEFRMPAGRQRGRGAAGQRTPQPQFAAPVRLFSRGGDRRGGLLGGRGDEEDEEDDDQQRQRATGKKRGTGYGRGYRYVAVRGVFPLQEQIRTVARATHELPDEVADKIEFVDFQLQRQTAVPGPDPWAGEWADVDLDLAMMVINEAADFALDPVEPSVTDDVITMPLPSRITGIWGSRATHPDIENYTLSDEEMEKQLEIDRVMIEQHLKRQQEQEKKKAEEVTKRGFASTQIDMQEVRREVARDQNSLNELAKQLDKEGFEKELQNRILARVTAAGRLLLYRYIDFDVEPGNAYRYRVRLELMNPNRDRLLEEVAHGGVVAGQTRWTEWSEPSDPVIVPIDSLYFVKDVSPGGGHLPPSANFDIFQWLPETGTMIRTEASARGDVTSTRPDSMKVYTGSFIGGVADTLVLDPAQGRFGREDVAFATDDVLIDLDFSPQVDPNEHPDLNLPVTARGQIDVPPQALVVDQHGELKSVDPISRQADYARAEENLQYERYFYQQQLTQFLEQEEQDRMKALEERYERRNEGRRGDDDDDDDRGGRSRRSNPRRKSRGR